METKTYRRKPNSPEGGEKPDANCKQSLQNRKHASQNQNRTQKRTENRKGTQTKTRRQCGRNELIQS